jgi:hypothetical protein
MIEGIEQLLNERENKYGNYHTLSNLTQTLNKIINQHYAAVRQVEGQPPAQLPHFMAESLHMICQKIARAVNGDPTHIDSWDDIAGYSLRVVEILKAQEAFKEAQAKKESQEAEVRAEVFKPEEQPTNLTEGS